jgi:hypothetical protein
MHESGIDPVLPSPPATTQLSEVDRPWQAMVVTGEVDPELSAPGKLAENQVPHGVRSSQLPRPRVMHEALSEGSREAFTGATTGQV